MTLIKISICGPQNEAICARANERDLTLGGGVYE